MSLMGRRMKGARRERVGRHPAKMIDVVIALLAFVSIYILAAYERAPRFATAIPPGRITAEGGNAFSFDPGFSTQWPYVIPSHPDFIPGPDDIKVSENGRFVGTLEPSHDVIRRLGQGRYNSWQGGLWFSSNDNTDPRTNGRTYGLRFKARLAATAALALVASLAGLGVLLLYRADPAIVIFLAGVGRRWSLAARARPHFAVLSRRMASVARLARHVPLTFGRTFALFCAVMLATFCWGTLARPMPLVFAADSFTYVHTGVLWAAGQSVEGQSSRDVGYPAVTMLALRLGSLDMIPPLQLFAVIAGLASVLGVLHVMLAGVASRLDRRAWIPRWILAPCACAVAAAYCAMLLSHDSFVIEIYRAMAEAPHFLPTALALLFFVGGWGAKTPARRLASMILSVPTAYLSIMVKPHTSVVLALCAISLGVAAVRYRRALRSPLILSLCALSTILIVAVHRFDVWVTPSGFDFGPKTLFCNHLDVVQPVFDTSTPERARIMGLLRGVLQNPDRWPLLGFIGDLCMYGTDFNRAMEAAAKSEGLAPPAWEQREFIKAVMSNPVGYGRVVWNQFVFFMGHPTGDIEDVGKGVVTDEEWQSFTPYLNLIRMSRDEFNVEVSNWLPTADPRLAAAGKSLLQVFSATFGFVALGSTVLAVMVAMVLRGRDDLRLEITMVAVAAFTVAFIMTPALAHTFDVRRYFTDILPFSLLWWMMGLAYLAHGAALLGTREVRLELHPGRPATAGAFPPSARSLRLGNVSGFTRFRIAKRLGACGCCSGPLLAGDA